MMPWFEDPDKAIVQCSHAIAVDSQNAKAFLYRGEAHRHKRNFDDAIVDLTCVIGMIPNNTHNSKMLKILIDAHICRGAAFANNDDLDEAIDDFSQAIELAPDSVLAWRNRGVAWHEKGGFDQAIADYSRAIELDSNDPDSYMRRGLSFKRLKKDQQARTDFATVRQLKKEGRELRRFSTRQA
jgi:Flp pilus assembly protein TadD